MTDKIEHKIKPANEVEGIGIILWINRQDILYDDKWWRVEYIHSATVTAFRFVRYPIGGYHKVRMKIPPEMANLEKYPLTKSQRVILETIEKTGPVASLELQVTTGQRNSTFHPAISILLGIAMIETVEEGDEVLLQLTNPPK